MEVKLVSITENPEKLISYIARVSNPSNQNNENYAGLIKYLIRNKHWSPFEHAHMTVEIKTSRAIAAQILRHRSFSFQEFSQRYSEVAAFEPVEIRRQAIKNRQSSTEAFDPVIDTIYHERDTVPPYELRATEAINEHIRFTRVLYEQLLKAGVAKEVARLILPLNTQTTIYMTGNIRSWIHYLDLRDDEHTQLEHQRIAKEIRKLFGAYLPTVSEALWQLKKEQSDKDYLWTLLQNDGYVDIDKYKNGIER